MIEGSEVFICLHKRTTNSMARLIKVIHMVFFFICGLRILCRKIHSPINKFTVHYLRLLFLALLSSNCICRWLIKCLTFSVDGTLHSYCDLDMNITCHEILKCVNGTCTYVSSKFSNCLVSL